MQISFKLDALCDGYLRVNTCVTEQRDMNNVPTMMYTPNKENYIQEMKVKKGMGVNIDFEKCQFEMSHMKSYELFQVYHAYFPIVFSINY